jgi:hypothetical protein
MSMCASLFIVAHILTNPHQRSLNSRDHVRKQLNHQMVNIPSSGGTDQNNSGTAHLSDGAEEPKGFDTMDSIAFAQNPQMSGFSGV